MLALSWLTTKSNKQTISPKEELFLDLYEECSQQSIFSSGHLNSSASSSSASSSSSPVTNHYHYSPHLNSHHHHHYYYHRQRTPPPSNNSNNSNNNNNNNNNNNSSLNTNQQQDRSGPAAFDHHLLLLPPMWNNSSDHNNKWQSSWHELSSNIKSRLEKCSKFDLKNNIVNRTKNGSSPFFIACELGHYNIVKYLLEFCDADIEQKGCYEALEDHHIHSVPPIWVAAISGHVKVVELLIKHNANVNSLSDTGSTPLRSVCFQCKYDDEVNFNDSFNRLAIDNYRRRRRRSSSSNNNNHIRLQEQNVNNNQNNDDLDDESDENYMKIVKLLVRNGADISIANYNGGTCLINSTHNYKLSKFILDNGADVNASDHDGKTALHYAILRGRLEVAKLLLSRGANPMVATKYGDDALKLACISGHERIFNYLIKNFKYPKSRQVDAYKLLGSSILELNYDLTKVKELWLKALSLRQQLIEQQQLRFENAHLYVNNLEIVDELEDDAQYHCRRYTHQLPSGVYYPPNNNNNNHDDDENNINQNLPHSSKTKTKTTTTTSSATSCDIRRSLAFGDIREISSESELLSLSADEFRIQSLIMSERILGPENRETIQRLLSRGTNYIKSLRPDRCIDLWIYALQLKLKHESIFNSESILAIETITNLFLDLLVHQLDVRFQDIYDVLSLLLDQLRSCQHHLSQRPICYLHQDIFDRLLEIIKNLLLLSLSENRITMFNSNNYNRRRSNYNNSNNDDELEDQLLDREKLIQGMVERLVEIHPITSNGSTLLHLSIVPGLIDKNDVQKLILAFGKQNAISLMIKLKDLFLENGIEIDVSNYNGLSPLQLLCSTNIGGLMDKKLIIKQLVESGAHLDRRPSSPEQGKIIRQSLRDAGIDPMSHLKLSCLAARQLAKSRINFDVNVLTKDLRDLIATH